MTPEGRVKAAVKKLLKEFAPACYYHMPIQNGMGAPTLDFVCAINGFAFAIETKAPGKGLTPRQEQTIHRMMQAGIGILVIDGPAGVERLRMFLESWIVRGAIENGVPL